MDGYGISFPQPPRALTNRSPQCASLLLQWPQGLKSFGMSRWANHPGCINRSRITEQQKQVKRKQQKTQYPVYIIYKYILHASFLLGERGWKQILFKGKSSRLQAPFCKIYTDSTQKHHLLSLESKANFTKKSTPGPSKGCPTDGKGCHSATLGTRFNSPI